MRAPQPAATPLVQLKHDVQLGNIPGMAASVLLLLLTFGAARPAVAQDTPRVQVFGGYSYTRFDTPSFGFSTPTGLNGYNFSPAYNFFGGFGVVAEVSGQYGSNLNLRDIAVGPQFLYPKGKALFFGHLLIGDARSLVRVGNSEEDTARAVALGGGMDFDISSRFAIRVFQLDYLHSALFREKQNNLRVSTGLVFHWGTLKKKRHGAPAPSP
ncbi:MAG: outer membrane beta-barrel protein [Terriglobales bacterium]